GYEDRGDRADQGRQQHHDPESAGQLAEPEGKRDGDLLVIGPDEPEHQTEEDRRADQASVDPEIADDRRPAPFVLVRHGFTPARPAKESSGLRRSGRSIARYLDSLPRRSRHGQFGRFTWTPSIHQNITKSVPKSPCAHPGQSHGQRKSKLAAAML